MQTKLTLWKRQSQMIKRILVLEDTARNIFLGNKIGLHSICGSNPWLNCIFIEKNWDIVTLITMDRFKMIFQYFQSNSESVMNGICGLLALASVKIYNSLDFNCPCLPRYNMMYGMGIMFVPPIALFLCGLIVNRQSVIMIEEWRRPPGNRKNDLAIVK